MKHGIDCINQEGNYWEVQVSGYPHEIHNHRKVHCEYFVICTNSIVLCTNGNTIQANSMILQVFWMLSCHSNLSTLVYHLALMFRSVWRHYIRSAQRLSALQWFQRWCRKATELLLLTETDKAALHRVALSSCRWMKGHCPSITPQDLLAFISALAINPHSGSDESRSYKMSPHKCSNFSQSPPVCSEPLLNERQSIWIHFIKTKWTHTRLSRQAWSWHGYVWEANASCSLWVKMTHLFTPSGTLLKLLFCLHGSISLMKKFLCHYHHIFELSVWSPVYSSVLKNKCSN